VNCPHCQQAAPFHGYRSRKPLSLFGSLPCSRAYYHCGRCGEGLCPWDDAVGLTPKRLTPAAEELATLAGTLGDSFEEAAQEILPRLAGLRLGESSVERTTEDAGQRLGEILDQQHTLGPKSAPWQWHKDLAGRTCAYASVDAVTVHQQGPKASAAPSRMPYVAMVYNPVPDLKAAAEMVQRLAGDGSPEAAAAQAAAKAAATPQERQRMRARYLAGLYSLEELGLLLRGQARQVDMEKAELWLALSDGGNGLEDFLRQNFNRADLVVILDFHHPAEDLEELARLVHKGDEEAAKKQAENWCQTMKYQGGRKLLEELLTLDCPQRAEVRKRYEEVLGYISNNVHRMDYPYYISQGWQIGSGPVESACKTVVNARMKLAGMRWGADGTDAVCHLRALFKSEKGQWDAFWQRSVN
jgi:hypothetical protein